MMVFEPIIIKATGMSELMGGVLIGGTDDSTGAVTIAGTALGATAQTAAVYILLSGKFFPLPHLV